MDEDTSRGTKGSVNDRRVTLRITQKQKEKLQKLKDQEEVKKLEKEVKKKQLISFISILPIAIFGNTIKKVTNIQDKKKIKKEDIFNNEDIKKEVNYKIVEKYENKLKNTRYELRSIYYDESIINNITKEEDIVVKEEPKEKDSNKENIDKINTAIYKVEELKEAFKPNKAIGVLDKDYIDVMAEERINEIEQGSSHEHSDIYLSLSTTVGKLDEYKEDKVEELAEDLEEKGIDKSTLDNVKSKLDSLESIDKMLSDFAYNQQEILNRLEIDLENDLSKVQRKQLELESISMQTALTLASLGTLMATPGKKGVKQALSIMILSFYYSSLLRRKNKTEQIPDKVDTTEFIEKLNNSTKEIDDMVGLINDTNKQIDSYIYRIREEYSEYSDLPEYQHILNNLYSIKKNIEEKEFEIEKIKGSQKKTMGKVLVYSK